MCVLIYKVQWDVRHLITESIFIVTSNKLQNIALIGMLNSISQLLAHCVKESKSICRILWSSGLAIVLYSWISSANR